jgi:predicted HicB family RNase H-like nuclease
MPSLPSQPRHRRYSVRCQARLDDETHAKLQELVQALYRKQAQILRYVMAWGLDHPHAWRLNRQHPDRTHLVHMLIDPELCQRVQDAAATHGVSIAAWVRQAMRHIAREDFPASWRAGETSRRSHESGHSR